MAGKAVAQGVARRTIGDCTTLLVERLRVAYVGRCCENALNADADDVQSSGRISTTRCRRSGTDIRGIARLGSTIAGCASVICRTTGAGCAFATCCTTGAGRVVCIWHTSRGGCIQVRNWQKSATLRPQHQSKNSQLRAVFTVMDRKPRNRSKESA